MLDIVFLHSLAILGLICFKLALFIWVRLRISAISEKIGPMKDDIILIKGEISKMEGRFNNFDTSYYENLLKKIATITTDFTILEKKVLGLDESVKNFYSKWARKLGNIAKKEEQDREAEEMTAREGAWPQMDLVEQASQMNNNSMPKARKSGWHRGR